MSDVRTWGSEIRICAEISAADPDTCKFTVSRTVHSGTTAFFHSRALAMGSPLVEGLFAIEGVAHVLVADNIVSVTKRPDTPWAAMKAAIASAIRTQLVTGVPAIIERPAALQGRSSAEVRAAVQELLDRQLNPSIAAHGGQISIVDVRDGRLLVAMSGGCQGCAASHLTLRRGLEVMVRSVAPEIQQVVDTTDHPAGKKPFYSRAD